MISNVATRGKLFRLPNARLGVARARGIGLIEVMVSVLVLAIGLMGIAAMQSVALRNGQSSLESSQAVMQTSSIIEAMRANRANAASYNGTFAAPPTVSSLATRDLNIWIAGIQGKANVDGVTVSPPIIGVDAQATIAGCPAACVITVQWNDSRSGTTEGGATRSIRTEASL